MEPLYAGRQRFMAGEVFIGIVAIAALYFGRPVLIPIAMAVLFSFVLTPLVVRLRHLGLPEMPAVMIVVMFAFLIVAGAAGLIGLQLTQLAGDLPRYQSTLEDKVHSLSQAASGSGFAKSIGSFLQGLNKEIAAAPRPTPNPTPSTEPGQAAHEPIPVTVVQPAPKPIDTIETIVGPLVEPLLNMGIIVVFVIFILLQRRDLRDRLIWLTGARDLRRATLAIDDAGDRLSRFFSTQTAINACFGVLVAAGLWLIGIPNPLLWGVLAMLLRFVPYIGTFISIALPLALATAVDPGWAKAVWTVALFATLELVVSQAVEPFLYGRSTGLSPLAVMIAATFWTWLWGPVGLLVSTPLTLLIVVAGQHVERLSFLAVIFGNAPALTPAESFFQRIMTGDANETAEQAARHLKNSTLVDYYDEVALPGLRMAQLDANSGALEPERLRAMAQTVAEVIENFDDYEDGDKPPRPGSHAKGDAEVKVPASVLCIAGRSPLDETAAHMLRQALDQEDMGVEIAKAGEFSSARIFSHDMSGISLICLSYLAVDGAPSQPKFLIRRLRRVAPSVKIIAGFWTHDVESAAPEALAQDAGADAVVTTLRQAVDYCLAQRHPDKETTPQKGAVETAA
jgi:predicted PurR-regulated permease PerM